VALAGRHVELLERLRAKTDPPARREVILEIILDGVAVFEEQLAAAEGLDEFKSRLNEALEKNPLP
jgi:hypothetical protein